jgi:hypothetical protein
LQRGFLVLMTNNSTNAYGDGRKWDHHRRQSAADVVGVLQMGIAKDDLESLRKNTLWLMDVLFPTGFTYEVNRGPSESVHGGFMEGKLLHERVE